VLGLVPDCKSVAIGLDFFVEVSDFGEKRSGSVKKIKTLFTKRNIICYISLHREDLISQSTLYGWSFINWY
jgi:hypothetical protein